LVCSVVIPYLMSSATSCATIGGATAPSRAEEDYTELIPASPAAGFMLKTALSKESILLGR
jgi:hypothetical protein